MLIDIKHNGATSTILLNGRLDTTTAPELERVIKNDIDNVENLVLDFKDLVYISSAGLRVLLFAQKKMKQVGAMKLINVSEIIMEVFDITGFSDILTIE